MRKLEAYAQNEKGVQAVMSWKPGFSSKQGLERNEIIELTPATTHCLLGLLYVTEEDYLPSDHTKTVTDIYGRIANLYNCDYTLDECKEAIEFLKKIVLFRKQCGGILFCDSNKYAFSKVGGTAEKFFLDLGLTLVAKLEGFDLRGNGNSRNELLVFLYRGENGQILLVLVHPPLGQISNSGDHPPPDLQAVEIAVLGEALRQFLMLLKSPNSKPEDRATILQAFWVKEYVEKALHLSRRHSNVLLKQFLTAPSMNAYSPQYHNMTLSDDSEFITANNRRQDRRRQANTNISTRTNDNLWMYRFVRIVSMAQDKHQVEEMVAKAMAFLRDGLIAKSASKRLGQLQRSGLIKGDLWQLVLREYQKTKANTGNRLNHRSVQNWETENTNDSIEARKADGALFWIPLSPNKEAPNTKQYQVGEAVVDDYGAPMYYRDETGKTLPVEYLTQPSHQVFGKNLGSLQTGNFSSSVVRKGNTAALRTIDCSQSHELRTFHDIGFHLYANNHALVYIVEKSEKSKSDRADDLMRSLVESGSYFWIRGYRPKKLAKPYKYGDKVLTDSGHPIWYFDTESREKKQLMYLQQPAAQYRFNPIDFVRSNHFKNPKFHLYLGDEYMLEQLDVRVNNDVLVRIVRKRNKDNFFSGQASKVAASATATTAAVATAAAATVATATITDTTTTATKVKRPSLSSKKATAKATKRISSSSSISRAASGKENKLPAKPQSKSEHCMIDLCKEETLSQQPRPSPEIIEIMDSSDDEASS